MIHNSVIKQENGNQSKTLTFSNENPDIKTENIETKDDCELYDDENNDQNDFRLVDDPIGRERVKKSGYKYSLSVESFENGSHIMKG